MLHSGGGEEEAFRLIAEPSATSGSAAHHAQGHDLVLQPGRFKQAGGVGDSRLTVGAGLVVALLADISVASRRRSSWARKLRVARDHGDLRPGLVGMAKAKYYLLTCEPLSGGGRTSVWSPSASTTTVCSHRNTPGGRLAAGAQTPSAGPKRSLNHWYRMLGPPSGVCSGWVHRVPVVSVEGLAAHRESAPRGSAPTPISAGG